MKPGLSHALRGHTRREETLHHTHPTQDRGWAVRRIVCSCGDVWVAEIDNPLRGTWHWVRA